MAEGSVSIDRKEQKEHGITAEILRQAKAPGPVAAFSLLSDWVESLCMSATALHVVAALAAGRTLRALARTAARGGMELPELLEDAPILEIGDLVTDHLQPKSSRRRRLLKVRDVPYFTNSISNKTDCCSTP